MLQAKVLAGAVVELHPGRFVHLPELVSLRQLQIGQILVGDRFRSLLVLPQDDAFGDVAVEDHLRLGDGHVGQDQGVYNRFGVNLSGFGPELALADDVGFVGRVLVVLDVGHGLRAHFRDVHLDLAARHALGHVGHHKFAVGQGHVAKHVGEDVGGVHRHHAALAPVVIEVA